jgi:N-acetylneuraminate synthase
LVKNALSIEQHVSLSKYCLEIGIEYLCTPFSWQAAKDLEKYISPRMYKIGSGELTDTPTLLRIAEFGKPMIVSTGMSEIWEIEETYNALIDLVPTLVLMNCTSAYPPRLGDVRLGVISTLQERFPRAIIGHSDHTNSIYTSLGAVALGAKYIEKHVTVDSSLSGPDQDVSITFDELTELIEGVIIIAASLNKKKELLESEIEIQSWARRSLVYLRDMKAGYFLQADDIWGKRPGTGIPSKNYSQFVGKKLTRDVAENTLLTNQDFESMN